MVRTLRGSITAPPRHHRAGSGTIADDQNKGAGSFQVTCRDRARWSAVDAYLRPALNRPNLTVRTHAQVQRVLLTGDGADGVVYRDTDPATGAPVGAASTVHAEAEVLLCGGSINSLPSCYCCPASGPLSSCGL